MIHNKYSYFKYLLCLSNLLLINLYHSVHFGLAEVLRKGKILSFIILVIFLGNKAIDSSASQKYLVLNLTLLVDFFLTFPKLIINKSKVGSVCFQTNPLLNTIL